MTCQALIDVPIAAYNWNINKRQAPGVSYGLATDTVITGDQISL